MEIRPWNRHGRHVWHRSHDAELVSPAPSPSKRPETSNVHFSVIHCWFVLREIRIRNPFQQERCPHCYGDLTNKRHQKQSRAMSHVSSDSKESYEPVHIVDADEGAPAEGPSYNHHDGNQPRPSTDDETARLV